MKYVLCVSVFMLDPEFLFFNYQFVQIRANRFRFFKFHTQFVELFFPSDEIGA